MANNELGQSLDIQEPGANADAFFSELNKPRTSANEAADANWQLAKMNSMGNRMNEYLQVSQEREHNQNLGRQILSPDELNRKYPGLKEKFGAPEYDSVASLIYKNRSNREALEEMIDHGPQDYVNTGTRWVQSLAAHISDPAELGTMITTGNLLKGVGLLEGATSTIGKLAEGITRGAVEMTGVEAANAAAAKTQGEKYTAKDYLENTLGGALAFEGAKFGIGRIFKGMHGFAGGFTEGLRGENVAKQAERIQVAQVADGRIPDVSHLAQEAQMEETATGGGKYTHEQFDHTKPVYAASEYAHDNMHEAPNAKIGEDFGDGFYMTDNPYAANGVAGSKFLPHEGTVFEGKLPEDTNLLHLDSELPEELRTALDAQPGETGRDVLERAREEGKLEEVKKKIQDAGYDGLEHNGQPEAPQNHVILFDKTKAEQVRASGPDKSLVPSFTPDEVKDLAQREYAPERDMFHDPEVEQKFAEMSKPDKNPTLSDLKSAAQESVQAVDELTKQGLFPEDLHEQLKDELKDIDKRQSLLERAHKAAIVCIGKG